MINDKRYISKKIMWVYIPFIANCGVMENILKLELESYDWDKFILDSGNTYLLSK